MASDDEIGFHYTQGVPVPRREGGENLAISFIEDYPPVLTGSAYRVQIPGLGKNRQIMVSGLAEGPVFGLCLGEVIIIFRIWSQDGVNL